MSKLRLNADELLKEIKVLLADLDKIEKKTSSVSKVSSGNFKKLKTAFNGVSKATKEVAEHVRMLETAYKNLSKSQKSAFTQVRNLKLENKALALELDRVNSKLKKQNAQVQKNTTRWSRFVQSFASLGGGISKLLAAAGILIGLQLFANTIKEVFTLTKTFDSLNFAVERVTGSLEGARASWLFMRELTEQYGVELVRTTNRWIKFMAAAKNSGLSLRDTERIFRSMTKASAILGLKTHELEGVYLALEQMLSKGKITTEELRRQLGERLPGAMGILAQSMGKTIPELDKMMKRGEILSAEVLPDFADAVEFAFGADTVNKIETLVAKHNRLKTAWQNLIKALTEGDSVIKKVFGAWLDSLTKILKGMELFVETAEQKIFRLQAKITPEFALDMDKISDIQAFKDIQEEADKIGFTLPEDDEDKDLADYRTKEEKIRQAFREEMTKRDGELRVHQGKLKEEQDKGIKERDQALIAQYEKEVVDAQAHFQQIVDLFNLFREKQEEASIKRAAKNVNIWKAEYEEKQAIFDKYQGLVEKEYAPKTVIDANSLVNARKTIEEQKKEVDKINKALSQWSKDKGHTFEMKEIEGEWKLFSHQYKKFADEFKTAQEQLWVESQEPLMDGLEMEIAIYRTRYEWAQKMLELSRTTNPLDIADSQSILKEIEDKTYKVNNSILQNNIDKNKKLLKDETITKDKRLELLKEIEKDQREIWGREIVAFEDKERRKAEAQIRQEAAKDPATLRDDAKFHGFVDKKVIDDEGTEKDVTAVEQYLASRKAQIWKRAEDEIATYKSNMASEYIALTEWVTEQLDIHGDIRLSNAKKALNAERDIEIANAKAKRQKAEDDKQTFVDSLKGRDKLTKSEKKALRSYNQAIKNAKTEELNIIADFYNQAIDLDIAYWEERAKGLPEDDPVAVNAQQQIAKLKAMKKVIASTDFEGDITTDDFELFEELLDLARDYSDAIGDLFDNIHARRIENINAEIQAETEKYDRLIELAEGDEEQQNALRKQKEDRIKKLEKKRLKEEQKQAKAKKAFAVVDIGIKTAQAIMGIWADVPKVDYGAAAGAMTALVSALGALQIAAVLSQPIPKYAEGGEITKEHIGMINDAGVREFVERDSTLLTTDTKNALVKLKPGDIVHKDYDAMINHQLLKPNGIEPINFKENDFNKLLDTVSLGLEKGFKRAKVKNVIKLNQNNDAYKDKMSRW